MIEKAVLARGLFRKEPQGLAHLYQGAFPVNPAPLGRDGPSAKREARGGDAGLAFARRPVGSGPIPHQSRVRVGLLDKESECRLLQLVQQDVILRRKHGGGPRPGPCKRRILGVRRTLCSQQQHKRYAVPHPIVMNLWMKHPRRVVR